MVEYEIKKRDRYGMVLRYIDLITKVEKREESKPMINIIFKNPFETIKIPFSYETVRRNTWSAPKRPKELRREIYVINIEYCPYSISDKKFFNVRFNINNEMVPVTIITKEVWVRKWAIIFKIFLITICLVYCLILFLHKAWNRKRYKQWFSL